MILVYNIGAKLLFGEKIMERAATHIVVQGEHPNVMMAMDIAKEIAQENILGDYNVPLAFVGHYVQVYPLDGGCGIALKDYLKSNDKDTIYNADDICDMEFEYDDLDSHTQGNVLDELRDRAEKYCLDWDEEIEDFAYIMEQKYGVEIDKKKCFFSIGYVQGDYGECNWSVKDVVKFLGDGYEKQFKKLSKRLLYRYLVKNNKIEISVKNTKYGYDNSVCIDFPYDYNQDAGGYTDSFWKLAEDLQEDIEEMLDSKAYEYNRKVYYFMRKRLEDVREDSNVEEYIRENDIVFDMDGNIIY